MKSLQNHTLIYDKDCPLCAAYTSGFVKTGMMDANGRKPFSELSEYDNRIIDSKRACNEIALINNNNQSVIYGIDSLLTIIGNSFPILQKAGNIKPVKFILKKLYSFISYNRKVIIPAGQKVNNEIQCIPDFNYKYRIAYIIFGILATAIVLYRYSEIITILPKGTFQRELLLATGQIAFQYCFMFKQNRQTIITYFGNLVTVSVFGSLLLLPALFINSFITIETIPVLVWFGITAGIMFFEHYRRVTLLRLPHYLCLTWVAYRVLALIIILNL